MTAELRFDASELLNLSRAIKALPEAIKTKAMASAMRRMREMARTRIVKRSAEHTRLPVGVVRKLTTARFNAGGNTQDIVVKSGWIHLYKLGATQTKRGVRVKTRGSYAHAFIATMKSGHTAVAMRVGDKSLPIRELFGPNPANAITNNPDVYLDVIAEIIRDHLAPRVLHEIDRLLPR
ncbi:phage tail protein [Rhizobiaceae bacterium n13]|uniref:phage tail protein n=1 Tax=Ferirhizobium litorale TaxID=2927786 RepID=UPI0024B305AE|nr:phage tail protein [Fererhizobium litorale]MDI7864312.1 phage tail protein [Fererhizobium litorale]